MGCERHLELCGKCVEKAGFPVLLGVFHDLFQKTEKKGNSLNVEISTFVEGVPKKWPIFDIIV